MKTLFKKCATSRDDPYLGLLAIRNTTTQDMDSSPSRRLFGRTTRTNLPTKLSTLGFNPPNINETCGKLMGRQHAVAHAGNRGRKDLPPLVEGQPIWHQSPREPKGGWAKAIVKRTCSSRRYEIETEEGQQLVRNRRFLKPMRSPTGDDEQSEIKEQSPARQETREMERQPQEVSTSVDLPGLVHEEGKTSVVQPNTPGEKSERRTRLGRVIKTPERLNL